VSFATLVVYGHFEPTSFFWGGKQPFPIFDVGGHEGPPAEEEETSKGRKAPVFTVVRFIRDLKKN